eukprot:CAMPEP_0202698550 /NCGR_PEP_ID=MMETSP1385-20130828/11826_1 /ASSEMBLY_ACC=CAM_ASM_000861 /TAXON_ID=933848 /ORGANISM="Elphidium margaritaceum" /LENGTH=116 /DNA_ID=CAMNT_0049355291 /DNA_START=23 /DNA_END=370 /DNA_ORIENTATION=-
MGTAYSLKAKKVDKEALQTFLDSPGEDADLKALWTAFDKDASGYIEDAELHQIIYHLIWIFWKYATPSKPCPKRDQVQGVVEVICQNVMHEIDVSHRGRISRAEFDVFGEYIMKQW